MFALICYLLAAVVAFLAMLGVAIGTLNLVMAVLFLVALGLALSVFGAAGPLVVRRP